MNLAETETVNQSPLEPKGWANPGGIRFGDFHHPSRVLNLVILKVQTFADMDYTDYTDYTEYTDYTDYTQTEHLRRLSSQEALFFSSKSYVMFHKSIKWKVQPLKKIKNDPRTQNILSGGRYLAFKRFL